MAASSQHIRATGPSFAKISHQAGLVEEVCRQVPELRSREERLSAIGEMTAGFAHQFRTPLASAMLYASQLDDSTPQQRRIADKISSRLHELGRMVNDMLGFAAGAAPAREPVAVVDLFAAVLRTIEPQLPDPDVLTVNCEHDALCVNANKAALKGALLNLINNAEQACHDRPAIELAAREVGGRVLLSVSDNGLGIAQEALEHLFEPFFTTRSEGTGLGLAVVQEVTKAHDGEVFVASTPQGSCFTLSLPFAQCGRGGDA